LQKGKYALFIAYDSNECIVILSKKTDAWGSFFYDEKDDALRVKVHPFPLEKSVERLRYEFTDQTDSSAVIRLEWEKLAIPFKIEVDYLQQQFEAIEGELKNPRGFTFESLTKGAAWCLGNNYQLEKGLAWINLATDSVNGFGGNSSYTSLSTKAMLLDKLGKKDEAQAVIRSAIAFGTVNDLHIYGKQLVTMKKPKEALEVFRQNYKNNPGNFITNVGMVRGLSANGNYDEAQKFAQKALLMAPDDNYKKLLQTMIERLKNHQDIN
jgi:tetratricopeptide (TPR) repeat protein